MNEFLEKVRAFAEAHNIHPSTVVQRGGKLGGAVWSRWEAGEGSPTLKTADKILRYMEKNSAPVGEDAT